MATDCYTHRVAISNTIMPETKSVDNVTSDTCEHHSQQVSEVDQPRLKECQFCKSSVDVTEYERHVTSCIDNPDNEVVIKTACERMNEMNKTRRDRECRRLKYDVHKIRSTFAFWANHDPSVSYMHNGGWNTSFTDDEFKINYRVDNDPIIIDGVVKTIEDAMRKGYLVTNQNGSVFKSGDDPLEPDNAVSNEITKIISYNHPYLA